MNAEKVYAVLDYYDGPESGFADFRGAPHYFEVVEEIDIGEERIRVFELTPANPEELRLVLRKQLLWSQWSKAYLRGTIPEEQGFDDRVLPGDLEEYRILSSLIASFRKSSADPTYIGRAEFDGAPLPHDAEALWGHLVVRWSETREFGV